MSQTGSRLLLVALVLPLLLSSASCFSFVRNPTLTQKCTDVLPYPKTNINLNTYNQWFGKVGEQLNGTTYENGHVFSRHVAVNQQCTSDQKKENKTVFLNLDEFYKAMNKDTTNCTMTSTTQFNFNQDHTIAVASDYIRGIDCVTGSIHLFSSYFVEYKRAIQKSNPSQAEYMASQKVTVWTFYPKR
jgi:hypothetical protein